ncbi:trigger factor [Lachnospiraceae bacterium 2_1_46FAA]|nr:trigger factor [Lachnospiraceae bacterium 2_1_46FAA]
MALPKNKNRDQRGRTMKKQRVIAAMLTLCLVVSAVGCSKKEISNEYVKISQYKGVEAEKVTPNEVTEDDITNYINAKMAEQTKDVTDRELRKGDLAQFEYTGKLKSTGKVFDEGTLTLGNGEQYVDGFEEGIYGHKLNETFDLPVKFPEGYGGTEQPELSGADVIFTIKITGIKERAYSELNDEFVKAVSKKSETVEEYKEEVKKEIEKMNKKQAEAELRDNAWNEVMDNAEIVKYPEKRLKEKEKAIEEQLKKLVEQSYGVSYEEFLKQSGQSEDDFKKQVKEMSKESLKPALVAELIAKEEGLEISDKEMKKEMKVFAKENGYPDADTLVELNGEDMVKEAILQNKVMEWAADNCKQVEKKKENKQDEKKEENKEGNKEKTTK